VGDLDTEIQGKWLDVQAIRVSVDKRTQSFHEELDIDIQGTWFDIQAMKTIVQATGQEFRTLLAEADAGCWTGSQPAHSPDLNPLNFIMRRYLKTKAYASTVSTKGTVTPNSTICK
jgi:hypothetical protein